MEHVACDLCNSSENELRYTVTDYLNSTEKYSIVRCRRCGLYFTNPRPDSHEIAHYYPQEYSPYDFSIPQPLFPTGGAGAALKNQLKKAYLRYHFNYFSTATIHPLMRALLRIVTLPVKLKTDWIFPEYVENGKVLDVGCSTGHYLDKLRSLGWETYGIEPNLKAAQWAKEKLRLTVTNDTIENAQFPDGFFDAITLWQALEHVHSPMKVLAKLSRMLKKGGQIIIGLPNIHTIERSLFKQNWWGWEAPRHLYHFAPETLQRYCTAQHLNVRHIEYPANVNNLLYSVQKWLISFSIFDEKKIKMFLDPNKNMVLVALLMPVGYLLALTGQVGRMIVYAEK